MLGLKLIRVSKIGPWTLAKRQSANSPKPGERLFRVFGVIQRLWKDITCTSLAIFTIRYQYDIIFLNKFTKIVVTPATQICTNRRS